MKAYILFFTLTVIIMAPGCTNPTSSNNGAHSLRFQYGNITMGNNSYLPVEIAGGTKPYKIKSISDSGKVSVYMYNNPYGKPRLELNSMIVGSTKITVEDSTGITGDLYVNVVEFAAFPSSVTIYPLVSTSFRIQGGTQPYSIEVAPDTSIVNFQLYSSSVSIYARKSGFTSITIIDASSPSKKITIPISVRSREEKSGKISFFSSVGNFEALGTYSTDETKQSWSTVRGLLYTDWSRTSERYFLYAVVKSTDNIYQSVSIEIRSSKKVTPGVYSVLGDVYDPNQVQSKGSASLSLYERKEGDTTYVSKRYLLTSGTFIVTRADEKGVTGSFSGNGYEYSIQGDSLVGTLPIILEPITIWSGIFDVPVVVEEIN